MAIVSEPTPDMLESWRDFVATRPDDIRVVAERFTPWVLYRMQSTGQRVLILGFDRNDDKITLTVAVLGKYNLCIHESQVFGIDPDDLVECDLPGPGEKVGAMLTEDQVQENIHKLRVMKRPDLWVMNADGIAVRRH